jgi:hypothetical protein
MGSRYLFICLYVWLRNTSVGATTSDSRPEIPKRGAGVRVLGIPAIRDRVVQGHRLILESIFEADFCDGSYGYRTPGTAHEAGARVAQAIVSGKTRVIDFDLAAYFDTVRHDLRPPAVPLAALQLDRRDSARGHRARVFLDDLADYVAESPDRDRQAEIDRDGQPLPVHHHVRLAGEVLQPRRLSPTLSVADNQPVSLPGALSTSDATEDAPSCEYSA